MGNRGILHDDAQQVRRYQATRAWIICELSFRGRHRELMEPGHYTELFFWDEVTALAAGHRPCFECRREEATAFLELFRKVTTTPDARASDMDARLAGERRRGRPSHWWGTGRILVMGEAARLPAGSMILYDGEPCVVVQDGLRVWRPKGYGPIAPLPAGELPVITPTITTRIMAAGYEPMLRLGN
jgi:hypothetical protein